MSSHIQSLLEYLGEPYIITTIDLEDVIYRSFPNGYEFEISGCHKYDGPYTLFVWKDKTNTVAIYSDIKTRSNLKDLLGFYATKYQNLCDQVRVEREP